MARVLRGALGRFLFFAWMLRRRLAETRRPRTTRFLSWFMVACGPLVLAEGVLLGWFLSRIVPVEWSMDMFEVAPWYKTPQWVAGVSLIIIGLTGMMAGLGLRGLRPFGAYLSLFLLLALPAVGGVLLYAGIGYDAPLLTAGGSLDLAAGLLAAVLLAACWYTLDPLGLHWGAGSEG